MQFRKPYALGDHIPRRERPIDKVGLMHRALIRIASKAYMSCFRRFQERPESSDYSIAVPFSIDFKAKAPRIAAVCHLFNLELLPEIKQYLENLPEGTDLFLTTDTEEKARSIAIGLSDWSRGLCEVRIVENRGRDIAPKYIACRDVLDRYELVVFVHSKMTASRGGATDWRKWLFESTCGSKDVVDSILTIFLTQPDIGVVFPQNFPPIRRYMSWNGMLGLSRAVGRRMGVNISPFRKIDFPAGSFFWARPKALKPILDLNLTMDDFPPEGGQTNSTIAHVLERLVLLACEHAGYGWLKVQNLQTPGDLGTVTVIRSKSDLDTFIRTKSFRLK